MIWFPAHHSKSLSYLHLIFHPLDLADVGDLPLTKILKRVIMGSGFSQTFFPLHNILHKIFNLFNSWNFMSVLADQINVMLTYFVFLWEKLTSNMGDETLREIEWLCGNLTPNVGGLITMVFTIVVFMLYPAFYINYASLCFSSNQINLEFIWINKQ